MKWDRRRLGRLAVAAAALGCAKKLSPRPPSPAPSGTRIRVLTYNVNFGLAGDPATVDAIRDATADLVLLQETNTGWEQALRRALGDRYPQMLFQNRGGAGGFAVLSRLSITDAEVIAPSAEGWFPAGRVIVTTGFGPLQALNVHLRPPVSDGGSFVSGYFTTPGVRLREMQGFVGKLKPGLATLVAGDFNEEPDGDVTEFLASQGLMSILPRLAPGTPTWRWQTAVGTIRRQLDHIAHSASLEAVSAGRSDHLPVVAVLRPR
jgi:endonuclease/exonuclease/phosphatase family metal-dependent hydrolase